MIPTMASRVEMSMAAIYMITESTLTAKINHTPGQTSPAIIASTGDTKS
jgi:hypothetical protein